MTVSVPRIEASSLRVGAFRCRDCQKVQDFELGAGEDLKKHFGTAVAGACRGLRAAYQFLLECLAVRHSGWDLKCGQRVHEFFVALFGHCSSPSSGVDNRSVGDGPRSGDGSSAAGHPEGGAL